MKLSKMIAVFMSAVISVGIFTACKKEEGPQSDSSYLEKVNNYSF